MNQVRNMINIQRVAKCHSFAIKITSLLQLAIFFTSAFQKKKKKCLGILRPLISFYCFERSRNIISNPIINISILQI